MHAELAYLFRHALLREAAYQLQPPTERAVLHAAAFEVLEATLAALGGHMLDLAALELADHAGFGKAHRPLLETHELAYLNRAYRHARDRHALRESVGLAERVLEHGLLAERDRFAMTEQLGSLFINLGLADRASEVLTPLPELCRNAGDKRAQARALLTLAMVRSRAGHVEESDHMCAEALEIAEALGDRSLMLQGMMAVAVHHLDAGRVDEGEALMLRAKEIAGADGNGRSLAICESNLGFAMQLRHRWADAEACYLRAIELGVLANSIGSQLVSHMNLVGVLREMGRPDDAAAHARTTLQLARQSGMSRYQASALNALGEYEWDGGNRAEGRRMVEEAASMAEAARNVRLVGMLRSTLAVFDALEGARDRAQVEWRGAMAGLAAVGLANVADEMRVSMREKCAKARIEPLAG